MAEKKKIKAKPTKKPVVKKAVAKSVAKTAPKVNAKTALDSVILRWNAPDYYTFEKSPYWSLAVGVLAIVFASILIYTNNYFPVIIIILAVIVTFQVSHEKPKAQEFAIDEGGILSRNQYIAFLELRSFWVTHHERKPILYLEPVNRLRSPIVIPLANQSSAEVRLFLLHHLPEKFESGELLSDRLMRLFRL